VFAAMAAYFPGRSAASIVPDEAQAWIKSLVSAGHSHRAAQTTRFSQRSGKLWATVESIRALPRLNFHEHLGKLKAL
jgi:hypothetical protein